MGKDKLRKFGEFDAMSHTFDYTHTELKGNWQQKVFGNKQPIVLELACGGGEYTLGLAQRYPDKNFIGVDIKGNRLWKGAKQSLAMGLSNVAFLRIQIEQLATFFEANEVDEIWITFPDPQPRESKVKKRLTSSRFLSIYREIAKPSTRIHLKTDSPLLFHFTKEQIEAEKLHLHEELSNVYKLQPVPEDLLIQTFYEKKWLLENRVIRYLQFSLFP
jgi:tRNA (guanine-N7-)-methyltransferase